MKDLNELINPEVIDIKPSGIRKYFDIAEQMKDVITLGVGEPDFPTPWHIRQAGIRSLEQSHTNYTSNKGLLSLREEISKFMTRKYALEYDELKQILVTVGGSEAIDACVRTIVKPGDEVIIPEPSFVCYVPIVKLAGGIPIIIETKAENEFRLTANELKGAITDRTKLLILPYPNNPTGAVMRREHLEEIAQVLRGTDILVLSDEIYSELTYGKSRHVSIAEIDGMYERTTVVTGFSKSYSMTGWRLGFAVGPEEIITQMTKIHQFCIMSAPTTAQYAAVEALRNGDDDIAKMRGEYDIRRKFILSEFRRLGLDCFEPEGAFYAFPCIKSTGLTSDTFCERLLKEKHVAAIPGTAFGNSGEGFIRISYCNSLSNLKTAMERIEDFLKDLKEETSNG